MIQFEITAVVKAKPGDFSDVAECMAALGKRADGIVAPYGGRLINVDCVTRDVTTGAETHRITESVILVMKASGSLMP